MTGKAAELLRTVIERDPENVEANHLLGALFVQAGRPRAAIPNLQIAFEGSNHAIPAGLLLASAYVSSNEFDEAVNVADRILDSDAHQTAARRIRANANFMSEQYAEAERDSSRLLELAPEDPQALALHANALAKLARIEEAEEAFFRLRDVTAASGDARAAARGCVGLARFYAQTATNAPRAGPEFERCLGLYPADTYVLQSATAYYDGSGRGDLAQAALERAVAAAPDNFEARLRLATRLRGQNQASEADALLLDGAERLDDAAVWQALARFRREGGDLDGAASAVERGLARSPQGEDTLLVMLADLEITRGRLDEAEAIIPRFASTGYRDLVGGQILLARGKPEEAEVALRAGTQAMPNNGGAHWLSGLAADQLGDTETALREYRLATRLSPGGTDAALFAARHLLGQGSFDEAAAYASRHLRYRASAQREAHRIASRAQAALGDYAAAERTLMNWMQRAGPDPATVVDLAAVERIASGPAAAASSIERSGLDLTAPQNESALFSLAQYLLADGQGDAALAKADAALSSHPDSASLHTVRGRVLLGLRDFDAARKEFERSLEMDPDSASAASALVGLGMVMEQRGEYQQALELLDRAAESDPSQPEAAYRAAQIALRGGAIEEAQARLREIVRQQPGHFAACNDLAWLLADAQTDLDFALELAQRATRLSNSSQYMDTLGWVQLRRGEAQLAIQTFESAVNADPQAASVRYHLGLARMAAGDETGAQRDFQAALDTGPFREADLARAHIAEFEASTAPSR